MPLALTLGSRVLVYEDLVADHRLKENYGKVDYKCRALSRVTGMANMNNKIDESNQFVTIVPPSPVPILSSPPANTSLRSA